MLIAVVSGVWLLSYRRNKWPQVTPSPAAGQGEVTTVNQSKIFKPDQGGAEIAESESTPSSLPALRNRSRQAVPLSFVLTPGVTRSAGEIEQLRIPSKAQSIELRLVVDSTADYGSYEASIRRVGESDGWHPKVEAPTATGPGKPTVFKLKLSAKRLVNGQYLLTLTGIVNPDRSEPIADYAFAVVLMR